jgi:hypothetical protein
VIPRLLASALWQKEEEAGEEASVTDTNTCTTTSNSKFADNNHDTVNESFLRAHGLKSMSFTTAWRWMRLLDFQYDARKKSFHVNGHE